MIIKGWMDEGGMGWRAYIRVRRKLDTVYPGQATSLSEIDRLS